jgi:hypothetical protein
MTEADDELAAARREATRFVREYFEDPLLGVQLVERVRQGTSLAYLFAVVGLTVTEPKQVRVRRYVGRLWVVEFAD